MNGTTKVLYKALKDSIKFTKALNELHELLFTYDEIKALIPNVELSATSISKPIIHDVNNPIDIGNANIQYIKNNCVHSGEKAPRGNVLIVKTIEIKSVPKIIIDLFIIGFFWFIVPY